MDHPSSSSSRSPATPNRTAATLTVVLLLLSLALLPMLITPGRSGAEGPTGSGAAATSQQPIPSIVPVLAQPSLLAPVASPAPPASPPGHVPSPSPVAMSPLPTASPSASPLASGNAVVTLPTVARAQASVLGPEQVTGLYGSITVRLWTCRAGYNPFGSGANLIADCVTPSSGEQFSLTSPNLDSAIVERTGGMGVEGALTIDGLRADTYLLSHRPPFRTAYSIPLACTTETPTVTATPPVNALAPTVTLVSISLPLAQGQTVVCDWYDVPQRRIIFPPQPRPSIGPAGRAP